MFQGKIKKGWILWDCSKGNKYSSFPVLATEAIEFGTCYWVVMNSKPLKNAWLERWLIDLIEIEKINRLDRNCHNKK